MLHEEIPKLIPLRHDEIHRLIQFPAGKVDGANQVLGAGRHVEIFPLPIQRQEMKLPRLSAIEHSEAIGIDPLLVEVDDSRHADILFDPGILDRLGVDAKEALGEIAEGAVRHFLNLENMLDLRFAEHALFNEQLSDLNAWQRFLPE